MTAQTIPFPRSRKRGAKVRTGPMAKVLKFPAQLCGDELQEVWVWLGHHHKRWDCEEITGTVEAREIELAVRFGSVGAAIERRVWGDAYMRSQVSEWRAKIEKRIAVKDWLEELGVDWAKATSAEQALFFVFDKLRERGLTPPAA